jgi:hypothetical protein
MAPSGAALFSPAGSTVNAAKAYRESFDNLPGETVVTDPLGVFGERGHDLRPEIAKRLEPEYRAIDEIMGDGGSFRGAMGQVAATKGLDTADFTLPVYPQEDLTSLVQRNTPVWDLLPKITSETKTVDQDSVTDLARPEIGGERDVPADQDDSYSAQSLSMSYYRITGSVSGPMQLASRTLRNAGSVEQRNKSTAMSHFSEDLVLNADPTGGDTSGGLTDERGYKGVRTLAKDNGEEYSPGGGDGSTITAEDVRANFRRAVEQGGNPATTIHATDLKTITDLKNSLDQHDPVMIDTPEGQINLGAQSVAIDGAPVVHSDFMPNTAYDATANPEGRNLLTMDMRFHSVRDLSSTVMEALAKTQDADEFFMKRYSVMMQDAGAHQYTSLISGLA